MLELAHNPADPEGVGRTPTPDEVTGMDAEFDALFFQLPMEEQVRFLSAISAREAALWLERMSTEARNRPVWIVAFPSTEGCCGMLGGRPSGEVAGLRFFESAFGHGYTEADALHAYLKRVGIVPIGLEREVALLLDPISMATRLW